MRRAFKKPHEPTRTQFTGKVESEKAPELDGRVNRLLAGEDKGTEKTSCPQVLLLFPLTVHLGHMGYTKPHGLSPIFTTDWLPLTGLVTLNKFQK